MSKLTNVASVACLIMVVIFAVNMSAFGEDSQVLNLHKVPEKVLISFNKTYPKAMITTIEKEKMGSKSERLWTAFIKKKSDFSMYCPMRPEINIPGNFVYL